MIKTDIDYVTMERLAKTRPVKFVEQYLEHHNSKPQVQKYGTMIAYDIMNYKRDDESVFFATEVYNSPFNSFITAIPGVFVSAEKNSGGPNGRPWFEAIIRLRFQYANQGFEHINDNAAQQIYRLLQIYNNSHYRNLQSISTSKHLLK